MTPDGTLSPRAGLLQCLCGVWSAPEDDGLVRGPLSTTRLAAGFAFAVLSQVISLSALPIAGAMLAPRPALATWPIGALILGAGVASIPASVLSDRFGRSAGFALGASLGVAGGLLSTWALVTQQFPLLVLASLWLGIAQGFGLFHRHVAAGVPNGATTLAVVLSAGALAGLVAPVLIRSATWLVSPYDFTGALVAATIAHGLSFGILLRNDHVPLKQDGFDEAGKAAPHVHDRAAYWYATLGGCFSWFVMARLMAHVPVGLFTCGVTFDGIAGLVAWHVVAMYAPALAASRLIGAIGAKGGLAVALAILVLAATASTSLDFEGTALVACGAGWSLATVAATLVLLPGLRSRASLAAHDGLLVLGALAGILL